MQNQTEPGALAVCRSKRRYPDADGALRDGLRVVGATGKPMWAYRCPTGLHGDHWHLTSHPGPGDAPCVPPAAGKAVAR